MRYPSSVLEAPLKPNDWKRHTKTVDRSGEGQTGIYFFKSKSGGVKDVVVKAGQSHESPEEKETANALMVSAGVPVPKTRIVPNDTTEADDLVNTAMKRGKNTNLPDASFFEVMAVASGKSLSSAAKKAGEGNPREIADKVEQLIAVLSTDNVILQLGQLMARDAILGNIDRVMMYASEGWSNLGNIMVTPGNDNKALPRALHSRIAAIDNELGGAGSQIKAEREGREKSVEELGTNPAAPVDRILNTLERTLASVNPEAGEVFKRHPQYATLRTNLIASLKKAALAEASKGVVTGPAPLAPTGNGQASANRPTAKPESGFEAEMRKRRRAVWEALRG